MREKKKKKGRHEHHLAVRVNKITLGSSFLRGEESKNEVKAPAYFKDSITPNTDPITATIMKDKDSQTSHEQQT